MNIITVSASPCLRNAVALRPQRVAMRVFGKRFQLLISVLIGVLCMSRALAADVASAFDSANKLYEQGNYADACNAYEQLVRSNAVSPAVLFNLGNAYFKSGQIGRAIATYRQMAELTPRDPDLRANLQFARNQVQGPTLRVSPWARWFGRLNVNEWTALASTGVWLTFLLLAVVQLRPALWSALRSVIGAFASTTIVVCACLGAALANHAAAKAVIVVTGETAVRDTPWDNANSSFVAHDGAELHVLDRKDDWLQVTDGVRRPGWVRKDKTVAVF
jgi:tetratricopeptide (TPR) repeat protein